MKRIFGYSKLVFISVTTLFLFFQGLELIQFSLAGFKSFLSCCKFILVVVQLKELTDFFLNGFTLCLTFFVAYMALVRCVRCSGLFAKRQVMHLF